MSEAVTLEDFLSPDFEQLPLQVAAGIERIPELGNLKKLLLLEHSGTQWASLIQAVAGKVRELLRVPITTIMARAWKDLKDVREAMETTRQSPDRTEVVALADHTIESEQKPYLELYQSGKQIGRIVFPVLLEIELRGLLLEIGRGTIQKMRAGDVRMKGTLKVGEFTLVEKAFEPLRLPAEIRFDGPTA
jgi:hypothetical protein